MAIVVNTLRWRRKQEDEEQQPITPYYTHPCCEPEVFVQSLPSKLLLPIYVNFAHRCLNSKPCLCLRFPCDEQFHHITPLQAVQRLLTLQVVCGWSCRRDVSCVA